jgi:hypothetical protein
VASGFWTDRRPIATPRSSVWARARIVSRIPPSARKLDYKKHTILFLAANPTGTSELALGKGARAIQGELERSGYRDCFELETRWAAQPLDLLRELRKLKPTVVHFSGHGGLSPISPGAAGRTPSRDVIASAGPYDNEPQRGLFFQGPDGRAQVVTAQALHDTFGAAGSSVKLVVLSACYSDVQAEALRAHVDCIVEHLGLGAAGARARAGARRGATRAQVSRRIASSVLTSQGSRVDERMVTQVMKILRIPMLIVSLTACLEPTDPATTEQEQNEIIEVHGCRPGWLQVGEECVDPRGGGPGGGGPTGGEREPRGPGTGGGGGGGGPGHTMDPEPDRNKDRRSCYDWCDWSHRQCEKWCWKEHPEPFRDWYKRNRCLKERCVDDPSPNIGSKACEADCGRRFPDRPTTALEPSL